MKRTTDLLLALRPNRAVTIVVPDAKRAEVEAWLAANRPDLRVTFQRQRPGLPRPQVFAKINDETHTVRLRR